MKGTFSVIIFCIKGVYQPSKESSQAIASSKE
jgi:hypothetical protein